MKVAIVIPIFNRRAYVKQCFDSLLKLTTKPDLIVLVDDASTDNGIADLLREPWQDKFGCDSICITNEKNLGVRGSLKKGIDYVFSKSDFYYCINLDSDAIVKPNFISKIESLAFIYSQQSISGCIISGFNCISDLNPVVSAANGICSKAFANGINMCFNKKQYEKYIKPSLAKDGNWDYNTSLACQADNLPFIITVPSVVQHIGIESSMGHIGGDFAQDFKRLQLPDVTLFGIDSHDVAGINRAAEISQRDIEFGAVKIITDDLFTRGAGGDIRRRDYSKFMLKELNKYFTTSHVLTIHADGYVLDFSKWDNSWLQYDYIGGTWLYKDGKNVGNGGFSLRSKKLCDILANNFIEESLMHPEDHCICRTYRKSLEDNFGIKFAPEKVANKFSIEAYGSAAIVGANKYSGQFGFHGPHVDFSGCGLPKDILLGQSTHAEPQQQRRYATNNRTEQLRKRQTSTNVIK